jgi:hypothetical protein
MLRKYIARLPTVHAKYWIFSLFFFASLDPVLPFLFPWFTLPLARRGAIVHRRRAKTFFWANAKNGFCGILGLSGRIIVFLGIFLDD